MGFLPEIKTKKELCCLVNEIGFITLFENNIPGLSVMDITRGLDWFEGDTENDPWEWRQQISAEGDIAYGKFFNNKAGFISKELFPAFANFRRDGYDFDSLYDEGLASRKLSLIMKLFDEEKTLPSYEIKRLAGFGKDGEKGFEGALSMLQMKTYLVVRGFAHRRNKAGEEYGWATGYYSKAEDLFGYDYVRCEYEKDPKVSKEHILKHYLNSIKGLTESEVLKLIS